MKDQNQKVESDSTAIQAGGSLVVVQGPSPEQIGAIVKELLEQSKPLLAAVAEETLKVRVADLASEVEKRLAANVEKSIEALQSPDFQMSLTAANRAYGRSGDKDQLGNLAEIIEARLSQKDGTRLAYTLNDAIVTTGKLTRNEFAELALIFTLRLTKNTVVKDIPTFLGYIGKRIMPFVDDASDEDSSYEYLAANACGQILTMFQLPFEDCLTLNYPRVLSNGFTKEEFDNHVADELVRNQFEKLVEPCKWDVEKFQLVADQEDEFRNTFENSGFDVGIANNLLALNRSKLWTKEQLVSRIGKIHPKFVKLAHLWQSTPMKSFQISTLGTAIAHANVRRVTGDNSDISIWIK